MKLRVVICIGAIVVYTALFNLYLYEKFDGGKMSLIGSKLLYNWMTFWFVLFFLLDWKAGLVNYMHKQLNVWCVILLLIHYSLIILTCYGMRDPINIFISFNLAVIISGVILAITYLRTTWKH